MKQARFGFVLARLAVASFVMLSAVYCLLAYIPFTYHQVHLGGLLPWLSTFAKFHPYLYWPAFIAALLTLPDMGDGRTRPVSLLFILVYGAMGIRLIFHPLLSGLENDLQSVFWALLAMTPLVWLGCLDWLSQGGKVVWRHPEGGEANRIFRACLTAAVYAWSLSAALFALRQVLRNTSGLAGARWGIPLLYSLACHLTIFMAIFLALNFTGNVAALVSKRLAMHVLFYGGAAAVMIALVLKFVVFAPLSLVGPVATVVATAIAITAVTFVSGVSVRLYRIEQGEVESSLALLLLPLSFLRSTSRAVKVALLVGGSALAWYALLTVTTLDWEYLIQTVIILCIWATAFAIFYTSAPRTEKRGDVFVVAAAALVCVYVAGAVLEPRWREAANAKAPQLRALLDEYADYDVGFRFARGLLSPRTPVASDDSLYTLFAGNTNISRSTRIDPVDVNLVNDLAATAGPKPHIFIFVIDSLRRDYLSPYNAAVSFTPAVDSFARESVVAQNAFTRYSGTGLSEPSIWSGAMLLHKQYITPFYPMNSLQKLLDVDGYRQFVTKDEILSTILKPSSSLTELDAGHSTMYCRLCQTLAELKNKISDSKSDPRPMFAYTQPQDIHVSVINREGRSIPAGENYPGFDDAYASRIRKMDQCFGEFIHFLKNNGLYDNSVVILTSDHGDSLGEHGKWGHAYNVVPEVVRVPLIIHLPAAMHSLEFEQAAPAFLIDITPSLYYLLGHRPIANNPLFGRPLFASTPEEFNGYPRNSYLIASSYGPVYGLLDNDGHSLYVVDGVGYKDYQYDWKEGAGLIGGTVSLELRPKRQRIMADDIRDIAQFYHYYGAAEPTN